MTPKLPVIVAFQFQHRTAGIKLSSKTTSRYRYGIAMANDNDAAQLWMSCVDIVEAD